MAVQTTIHQGQFEPGQEKTYFHLPFDMPTGAVRLEVEFDYSDRIGSDPRLIGGNTIDLGLFDQRGIEFLQAGIRGWSGSERERFFISDTEATPGYLPGSLEAGQWHVLFGLYKIADKGCGYRVVITITTQTGYQVNPVIAGRPSLLPVSISSGKRGPWYRGELHCHTCHSDGVYEPAALVNQARARGLDFLAVTDHNTLSSLPELRAIPEPGLVLIRGVEVTTFKGHFTALGVQEWVDFRISRPEQMIAAIDAARRMGGLTTCAHPKPLGPGWEYLDVANFDAVEVWNGPWTGLDEVSLYYWLELLAAGRHIPAVGGSDFHREGELAGYAERQLGTPTNWVYQPGIPTETSIMESIRSGHVSISEGPDGPFLELLGGPDYLIQGGDEMELKRAGRLQIKAHCLGGKGNILKILDQSGVLVDVRLAKDDASFEYQLTLDKSIYIRAELRSTDDWMRALTNPIYIKSI